mgnify:CR=1 FL=1
MPNAVAVWKCADSAIQRMATFTGGQTTVSAYLRLQTERVNYGELIIQKTSEDGKKSGFTFKVTRDTDNWSVTVKTDDNGTAKISELPVFRDGTSTPIQYTVTEVNTPTSYRQPKPQTITLTSKSSVTVQFENALIRDIIYCQQMSNNAPVLTAKSRNDIDGFQVAMMISSIIMDIDVENKLRSYDMHIDDIDTMRLSDLYAFLKSGMADYNRELYNVFTGLQITLLYFTTSKRSNIEEIIETFYLSDKSAMDAIDKYVDIIDRYGVDDNRSMMRCMRKLAIACGMKGRLLLEYEGKVTEI